jgi:cell division cycle 2-like
MYLTERGINLLKALLSLNPDERISAEQALAHPWFTENPLPTEQSGMPAFPEMNKMSRD